MVDQLRRDPPPGTSDMSRIRNDLEREHELRRELISALQDFGMDINNGKHLQDESLVSVHSDTRPNRPVADST